MSNTAVVRAMFAAYIAKDYDSAAKLISAEFSFTSPQDDHIDKAAFLERCFPTAWRFTSLEIMELVAVGDDAVFALYEYELATGDRYRNAEFTTVRHELLVETQVFFGGTVRRP